MDGQVKKLPAKTGKKGVSYEKFNESITGGGGIIAILVMIGIFAGCEATPENQTHITVKDIPSIYNNKFARVATHENATTTVEREYSASVKIVNGQVNLPIFKKDDKPATAKNGWVSLKINTKEDFTGTELYNGKTNTVVSLGKAEHEISATIFTPDIGTDLYSDDEVPEEYIGVYKCTYASTAGGSNVTETIRFGANTFNISDDENTHSDADFLNFTITKWEIVAPIDTTYTDAYKFTGKIVDQNDYVPSTYTAPGASDTAGGAFSASDVKADGTGPDCFMYIYIKPSDGSFKRSAFTKSTTARPAVVTGAGATTGAARIDRVYAKQPD